MNATSQKFLFDLLNTPSPTGFEIPGLKLWAQEVKKHADAVENDSYGNTWATVKGKTDKVLLLEAHADEIGYIVKHISKEGLLSIDVLGGSDAAVGRGRRVTIYGDKKPVQGIIGNTAIHLRENREEEKVPKVHELFVDIGAKDDKEVAGMGVRIGHPLVYSDQAMMLGKHCITSRAIDNRLGGFIIAEVIKKLSKKTPQWTVVAANAIQEEIGCFGARMVTHTIAPDAAICFDVTHATDTPGIKKEQHGRVDVNKGPTITHAGCNHPLVVQRIEDVAKKKKIPLQHETASRYSGTDAGVIYFANGGIPSALVSLPLRYMHSAVEMVDLRDIEKTIDLLTGFVESLSAKDAFVQRVV